MQIRPIVRIAVGLFLLVGELQGGMTAGMLWLEIVLEVAVTVTAVWLVVTGIQVLTAHRRAKVT